MGKSGSCFARRAALLVVGLAPLAGVCGSLTAKIAAKCEIVKTDELWNGSRTVFKFQGREAWVIEPHVALPGKPWTWTMMWWGAFVPRTHVPEMIRRGCHHAVLDMFDTRAEDKAMPVFAAYQKFLVEDLGLAPKANLIGMSWGGFFSVRYASHYPQNVAKIYLDAPLLNLEKFNGGTWQGPWEKMVPPGGWTNDPRMPINMGEPIAKAKIPILLLYGGKDQVVDPALNCNLFIPKFKAAGGNITVVPRNYFAHHPHGVDLDDPTIVDFFLKDAMPAGPAYWTRARYTRMTSPAAVCTRPGEKFVYQFSFEAAQPYAVKLIGYGDRPIPKGVTFDAKTGVLSGSVAEKGSHMVTLAWTDERGKIVGWGDVEIRVTDARKPPKTLAGETIYQIQIQGFDKEANFKGVRKHLKRIADLGVTWIYLSPITAADRGTDRTYWSRRQRQYENPINPYRPADYYHVDPNYGTDADFKALVDEAHALGLKVMTDVVFFHSGPNAVFLKDHPDWICRDKDGKPVRNEWMFPKLDIANPALRKYLTGSLRQWAVDYGVDGFRTDCGCSTPLDYWLECQKELDAAKPGLVWLLEGVSADYAAAFDVFYGFSCTIDAVRGNLDEKSPATKIREVWLREHAEDAAYRFRGTDTHDIANNDGADREEKRWGHKRAEAAIALCFALDGPAWIFEGQEIGWSDPFCIFQYTHPNWEKPECPERAAVIRRLATMKKTEPAFGAEGRLVWLAPDEPDTQLLFLRVAPDGRTFRCFFDLGSGAWEIKKTVDR